MSIEYYPLCYIIRKDFFLTEAYKDKDFGIKWRLAQKKMNGKDLMPADFKAKLDEIK